MNPEPSPKFASSKPQSSKLAAAKISPPPVKMAPLFRPVDWLALVICFAVVGTIYFLTLAPEVTLEDSGELTTGSFWAGIPHPPGYPFWAIYSWLWTELVPFGNVAWRVELGEAAASAMGCSLIAFMVSRGSSMFLESIEELRGVTGKWEKAICLVCGVTAGLLMALDDTMWFESVAINRISLFGVPWVIIMLLSLMRWVYAPRQRGYLYCAFFFLGLSVTIHQSLVVAALGIEIGIAFTQPKLGRDLFFCNVMAWLVLLVAKHTGTWTSFAQSTDMVSIIVNAVGIGSAIACAWMAIATRGLFTEIVSCLWMGFLWVSGALFYLYEAIAGMTNPPMEWGYPRTVEGFFHALTRGQYEKVNPTDVLHDPLRFLTQLGTLLSGVADAFNWVYLIFALLPFLFFRKMQKRERNWLISVAAIYPFLGVMMTILLNPSLDKQSAELLKVFFVASHTVVAILIGYGLALTAAWMTAHYQSFRLWGWVGGAAAVVLACACLLVAAGKHYFGLAGSDQVTPLSLPHWVAQAFAPGQYGLPIFANLLLLALPLIFLLALFVCKTRAPLFLTLGLFAVMPVYSGLAHWFHSEQRGHWFGYWYGHDMFAPPFKGPDGKLIYDAKLREQAMKGPDGNMVYPEIARDAVLYGGTDPGRFCPTYMVFCESFIPHRCQPEQDPDFDRRDVYIITQNALADPTYLDYIRAQYNRSLQIDPPFFQNFLPTEFPEHFKGPTKALFWLDDIFETLGARIEWRRRTESSLFKPGDFTDVEKLAARLRPHEGQDELSKYVAGQLSGETGRLVQGHADQEALSRALAEDFNRLLAGPTIYSAARFQDIKLPLLIEEALTKPQPLLPATTFRLNRRLLEEAYPAEIARSLGGVYPDTEIHTASDAELGQCEQDYTKDAAQRYIHDHDHPNEPPQIRPGEEVRMGADGRFSFGGVLVSMGINSFVTKAMFDANPDHEFYVEESYPMDWMYSYLTPYGIIMKVNRNPLPELSGEIVARDHRFWSDYSGRLIGNWVTYDTTPKELCDFAEKVYLRHDYSGFKGDRKFMRDEDAQKSFSKLRTAIGESIYEWRAQHTANPAERARMQKEADFAFKQAFAFCPYSEAVFRYAQSLLDARRVDDAILVAKTCLELDPFNPAVQNMVDQLTREQPGAPNAAAPVTSDSVMAEIEADLQARQTNQALQLLEAMLHHPQANVPILLHVAEIYAQMGNFAKSEEAMQRTTQIAPKSSVTWYNLALLQAIEGQAAAASASLAKAFAANTVERAGSAQYVDLRQNARTNPVFEGIRQTPEFRAVLPQN